MTLDQIVGQDRAVGLLRRVLAADRLAHAYVFAGPEGTGRRTTALALARACLCTAAPGVGCGNCVECRLIEAGSHPDVFVEDLARAQLEKATASHVSIEQVRRVCSHLGLRPVRGEKKFGLVDQAERLTADAQNALLKTLEEPRGNATLVLVATNADALLPTIRSRCQRLAFAPLEAGRIAAMLEAEGVPAEAAGAAAALADGSLGRARALASGDGAERCREFRSQLERVHAFTIPELLDLATELCPPRTPREEQGLLVATLVDWCREEVRSAVEESRGVGSDLPDDPEAREAALDRVRRAVRQLERAYATSRDLDRSANAHLAWDCLLLDLARH